MKTNKYFFNNFSNLTILFLIFFVFFLKIFIYVLVNNGFVNFSFGGGSDANYYHAYAVGDINIAVNIWPVILRFFNDIGLYSRIYVSNILMILNFIIPFLCVHLAGLNFKADQKNYLYLFLICTIYPTLFFYSLDIYRDVFMVFLLLLGFLIVKKALNNNSLIFIILYLLAILVGLILIRFRPYLGYAFILALFLWKMKFNKKRVIILSVLYVFFLFVANYFGFFSVLTEYRSGFEETGGGSTLGLNFSNPIMFVPNLILSTLGQLFGLYITNPLSIILLVVETIPFFLMLLHIIKNINYADGFVRFLIIFFLLYSSVWLIGNDNLGTAVRLRMYNYLVIYICFFYILKIKSSSLLVNLVNKK